MACDKERGPMRGLDEAAIRQYHAHLVKHVKADDLIHLMLACNAFDTEDLVTIKQAVGPADAMETFLEILYWSGKSAFKKFMDALEKAGYVDIYKTLKEIRNSNLTEFKKERGPLNQQDADSIRVNTPELLSLESKHLRRYLFQNGVLDTNDLNLIREAERKTKREGMEELLQIINNSGQFAYPKFLQALRTAGYHDLVKRLPTPFQENTVQKMEYLED